MIRRVLAAGSRDWPDDTEHVGMIEDHLYPFAASEHQVGLTHGGARGVDSMAHTVWMLWARVAPIVIRAPWDGPCLGAHRLDPLSGEPWCQPGHRRARRGGGDYCPKAGHRRNQHMVEQVAAPGLDDAVAYVFILNGSRGALDCARRSEHAGILTTRVELDL